MKKYLVIGLTACTLLSFTGLLASACGKLSDKGNSGTNSSDDPNAEVIESTTTSADEVFSASEKADSLSETTSKGVNDGVFEGRGSNPGSRLGLCNPAAMVATQFATAPSGSECLGYQAGALKGQYLSQLTLTYDNCTLPNGTTVQGSITVNITKQ